MIRTILDNIARYQKRKKEVGDGFLWPLTIIHSRYNGVYEGGPWLAFFCYHYQIPEEVHGGDLECEIFFRDHKDLPIGRGQTPDGALNDLINQIETDEGVFQ